MQKVRHVKPPFAYYGGKQQLARKVCSLFPPHLVYCEPFCGGAGVFWKKFIPRGSNNDRYREVLNDTNWAIVDVFRALRDCGNEVLRRMQLLPYSQVEYERARDLYHQKYQVDNIAERAALLLLFWSASFSGKATGGIKRSRSSENPAATWANKQSFVKAWCQRLRRVYIESVDAIKCIKRWDSPQTLYYVDPPYLGANQGHYAGWSVQQQQKLLDTLHECKGSFILSGYDHQVTRRAATLGGWDKHLFCVTTRAHRDSRDTATECIWVRQRQGEPTGKARRDLLRMSRNGNVRKLFAGSIN